MGEKVKNISPVDSDYPERLITKGDLLQFQEALIQTITKLIHPVQQSTIKPWLKSAEVRQLLSISPGSLQNLRISGVLPYIRVGGTIYYKWQDLEKLMVGK